MKEGARRTALFEAVAAAMGFVCLALLATGCSTHGQVARQKPTRGKQARSTERSDATTDATVSQQQPMPRPMALTLEKQDPKLSVALFALAIHETAGSHLAVANEYRRLRVFDRADQHMSAAIRRKSKDANLYDVRARVRRDMSTPALALGDAHRAYYFRPSAATANTVGTVFEALGDLRTASEWYDRALKLEPKAWFALNNVCHIQTILGVATAVATCTKSLAAAPSSQIARNNMALAQASAGDFGSARELFSSSDSGAAAYNMGIIYMATKHFDRAVTELTLAATADPASQRIKARLAQASSAAQH